MRIFLIGYMGSGKTSIGQVVAERLDMDFIDMDERIEKKEQKSISAIFAELGEEKFRELERECLMEIAGNEHVIISTGGGAPCFFDNMELMNRQGETIYINLSAGELAERLLTTNLRIRPILATIRANDLEQFIAENLTKREVFYNKAKLKVTGSDEEIARQIISFVRSAK